VTRHRSTTVALVVVTVLAMGYVMFVPARSYLAQQHDTDRAEVELARVDDEIEDLRQRRRDLQDPAEIERVAREEFNLVYPGEESFALLPAPPPPLPIPAGWPFDVLRGAAAAGRSPTG